MDVRIRGGGGIVSVDPKPRKGVIFSVLDLIEKAAVYLMWRHPPNPNPYLSGCFNPVKNETPPCRDLTIRGYLPCLNGEFVRIGSNPKYQPVSDALGLSREIGPSTTSGEADSTLGKSNVLPSLPGNYGSQVTIPSGSSDEDGAKGSDANDAASSEVETLLLRL